MDIYEARDAIQKTFLVKAKADMPSVNEGAVPKIFWDNLDKGELPPADKAWMRCTVRHVGSTQDTLGERGNRRFERTGLVTVQVFVPAGARGLALVDRLGKIVVDAFEGETAGDNGEIWFRDVAFKEADRTGNWFQANVTAEFLYGHIK